MKRAYFTTCAECGGPHPNDKGVCSHCEVEHGYANDNRARVDFVDDVDPAAREENHGR